MTDNPSPASEHPFLQRPWDPSGQNPAPQVASDPQRRKKRNRTAGGAVGAFAVLIGAGIALFGGDSAPSIGDCVEYQAGTSDVPIVDCGTAEANAHVVGIEDGTFSESEYFDETYIPCTGFPSATASFWWEPNGRVYCVELL